MQQKNPGAKSCGGKPDFAPQWGEREEKTGTLKKVGDKKNN